jgi:parallel beta-helix repeat protein
MSSLQASQSLAMSRSQKDQKSGIVAAPKKPVIRRVPDNFPTLQEAIDASEPNDCIFVAPAEIKLAEPLRISKAIHIMGQNESGERTRLVFDAQKLRPAVPLLKIAASCRVQGFVFAMETSEDATAALKASTYTVHISGGDLVMTNCAIQTTCSGIYVAPGSYSSFTSIALRAAFAGVTVEGKAFIERSAISDCVCGVKIAPQASVVIERSHLTQCAIGVDIRSHTATSIRSCTVNLCQTGILSQDDTPAPQPPEIRGNNFTDCTRGIFVEGEGCVCDIHKNFFERCKESAICIDGGDSFISGNAVKNCATAGICVQEGKPQITCNVVEDSGKYGIYVVGAKSSPALLSNEIHRSKGVGIAVVGSAAPRVESNKCHDNDINIQVTGALGLYARNELGVSQNESVLVSQQGASIVFEENDVQGSTTSCGICVEDSAMAVINANSFAGTKLSAVILRGCAMTDVTQNDMDPETCQAGAVVAQKRALAKIRFNSTNGLDVTVFSDSSDTVMVQQ